MPNWVTNQVRFYATDEQIAEIKEFVNGEREFDFNKIAPIPKELEGTRCPMIAISQEEYDEQEKRIANNELTENEKNFGISRCLTQELIDEYNEKFGACDWYGWQTENWGTKWNACEVFELDEGFEFQTAWSTPFEILRKLSKLFPDVEIEVRFSDEDFGYNVGEYTLQGGDEVDTNMPDGGSRQALELAMDIQYGGAQEYPFDDYEVFTELYDEDELNNYVRTMIDIAYDNKHYPYEDCGYHKLALEYFKEIAMERENYELVAIIQKELDKVIDGE